jgi:superfamily II DNA or RNA helicase
MEVSLNPTYELRSYQSDLMAQVFRSWGEAKRVMLQLPTGGGKTVLFGAIAKEFIKRGETVLVLAHREELILQAADKVSTICQTSPGIIKAGYKPDYARPLQIASVPSLVNRLSLLENVSLAIVDEAHHSTADTYRKILEAYPDTYQLGVTATPIRLDGTGFRDLFDVLICGPTVSELIKEDYLCPFRLYADPNPMSTHGVKTQGGDYVASSLAKANDVIQLSGNLIKNYLQYAPLKRCVVFAINVEHSTAIANNSIITNLGGCIIVY